jgi:hypothetical protein
MPRTEKASGLIQAADTPNGSKLLGHRGRTPVLNWFRPGMLLHPGRSIFRDSLTSSLRDRPQPYRVCSLSGFAEPSGSLRQAVACRWLKARLWQGRQHHHCRHCHHRCHCRRRHRCLRRKLFCCRRSRYHRRSRRDRAVSFWTAGSICNRSNPAIGDGCDRCRSRSPRLCRRKAWPNSFWTVLQAWL